LSYVVFIQHCGDAEDNSVLWTLYPRSNHRKNYIGEENFVIHNDL
jgi:hypothetical protein